MGEGDVAEHVFRTASIVDAAVARVGRRPVVAGGHGAVRVRHRWAAVARMRSCVGPCEVLVVEVVVSTDPAKFPAPVEQLPRPVVQEYTGQRRVGGALDPVAVGVALELGRIDRPRRTECLEPGDRLHARRVDLLDAVAATVHADPLPIQPPCWVIRRAAHHARCVHALGCVGAANLHNAREIIPPGTRLPGRGHSLRLCRSGDQNRRDEAGEPRAIRAVFHAVASSAVSDVIFRDPLFFEYLHLAKRPDTGP